MIAEERAKVVQVLANLDEITDRIGSEVFEANGVLKSLTKIYTLLNTLVKESPHDER